MKFWATPKFQKLQARWYKKLAEFGFYDIEINPNNLREDTARVADADAIKQYYRQASDYLHTATFNTEREQEMWQLHCEGLSLREIGLEVCLSKSTVQRYLEKHRKLMKTHYVD